MLYSSTVVELSQMQARTTAQGRPTDNRDRAIPRVNTQLEAIQRVATLSTASRGPDGGAESLRRIFGLADEAAETFSEYANTKFEQNERDNAARGVTDQLVGTIDPALQERSAAYRDAVTSGEAQKAWHGAQSQLEADLNAALNDPDSPADLEDVQELIDHSFSRFAMTDGKPKDFGSRRATLEVGTAMIKARAELMDQAQTKIAEQVRTRSVITASSNYREGLSRDAGDFETALTQIVPGTDMKEAKAALLATARDYALSIQDAEPDRALGVLDGLLVSKRADGTPSLSPKEMEGLRNERRQLAREVEVVKDRVERERWETNSDKLLDRFNRVPGSGGYPTVPEILELRKSNTISAEFAGSMISSIRADHEMNGSGTVNTSRGGNGSGADVGSSTPAASDLLDKVFSGDLTVSAANTIAARWAAEGRFGTGKARYKALAELRKNFNIFNGLDKSKRDYVSENLLGWKRDAVRRAQSSGLSDRLRVQFTKDADDVAKRVQSRMAEHMRNPDTNIDALLSAGLRAATQTLRTNYNLKR